MGFLGSEFERTLGEPAHQGELLPSEMRRAEALAEGKYATSEWSAFGKSIGAAISG
jgi:hypothetical protein